MTKKTKYRAKSSGTHGRHTPKTQLEREAYSREVKDAPAGQQTPDLLTPDSETTLEAPSGSTLLVTGGGVSPRHRLSPVTNKETGPTRYLSIVIPVTITVIFALIALAYWCGILRSDVDHLATGQTELKNEVTKVAQGSSQYYHKLAAIETTLSTISDGINEIESTLVVELKSELSDIHVSLAALENLEAEARQQLEQSINARLDAVEATLADFIK